MSVTAGRFTGWTSRSKLRSTRFILTLFISALSLGTCNGLTVPTRTRATRCDNVSHRTVSKKQGLLVSPLIAPALIAATLAFSPAPSLAVPTTSVFTNDYADPFHPLCERHIVVSSDGKTFHYSGTAVGPRNDPVRRGCTKEEIKEFGLRRGAFDGTILGDKISAGDGIHEGVWEPANSVTTNLGYENEDGIRWNDGNKWTVLPKKEKTMSTKIGEVIFYAYIGFSTLAGVKGVVDGIKRKHDESK